MIQQVVFEKEEFKQRLNFLVREIIFLNNLPPKTKVDGGLKTEVKLAIKKTFDLDFELQD